MLGPRRNILHTSINSHVYIFQQAYAWGVKGTQSVHKQSQQWHANQKAEDPPQIMQANLSGHV
jgi:hypothetical protein